MSAKDDIRDQVRAALVENLGLKVLSLLCAVTLYAFINGPETAQRAFTVSVLSIMPPDAANRALLTPLPTEVGITLRGPRKQLDDLHADDISALRLDLRGARDGKIELDPSMFHVPPGLTVEQIIPSSIRVRWDDVIAKDLPVQVPRTGEPAPGTDIHGVVTTDPAEVHARGPRSLLDVIQVARANPYDVTGLGEGDHTIKLPLDKPLPPVTFDVDHVAATVHIMKQLVSKSFPKLKVEVIGPPRASTRPATVTIAITGTAEEVGSITPDSIVPRVEPKAAGDDIAKPGNDNLPVLVDVPKGVSVQVDPAKVVVNW